MPIRSIVLCKLMESLTESLIESLMEMPILHRDANGEWSLAAKVEVTGLRSFSPKPVSPQSLLYDPSTVVRLVVPLGCAPPSR